MKSIATSFVWTKHVGKGGTRACPILYEHPKRSNVNLWRKDENEEAFF